MGRKQHSVESIVSKLRKAEDLMATGQTIEEVVRQLGFSDTTYYKWRKEYCGCRSINPKQGNELEQENQEP